MRSFECSSGHGTAELVAGAVRTAEPGAVAPRVPAALGQRDDVAPDDGAVLLLTST